MSRFTWCDRKCDKIAAKADATNEAWTACEAKGRRFCALTQNGISERRRIIIWHYTVKPYLASIISDHAILLATTRIPIHERPAVWFSTNPRWEQTANRLYRDKNGDEHVCSMEETHAYWGLARIGVDEAVAPHTWAEFKKLSGVRPAQARALAMTATKVGANHEEWRVTFAPVIADQWITVEVLDGEHWRGLASTALGAEGTAIPQYGRMKP